MVIAAVFLSHKKYGYDIAGCAKYELDISVFCVHVQYGFDIGVILAWM